MGKLASTAALCLVDQGRAGQGHEQAVAERMLHDLEPVPPGEQHQVTTTTSRRWRGGQALSSGSPRRWLRGHRPPRARMRRARSPVRSVPGLPPLPLPAAGSRLHRLRVSSATPEDIPRNRSTWAAEQVVFRVPAKGVHQTDLVAGSRRLAATTRRLPPRNGCRRTVQQFRAIRVMMPNSGPAGEDRWRAGLWAWDPAVPAMVSIRRPSASRGCGSVCAGGVLHGLANSWQGRNGGPGRRLGPVAAARTAQRYWR